MRQFTFFFNYDNILYMKNVKENNFIFTKINSFNDNLFDNLYEIIKNNMIKIGFEINENSKNLWLFNINKLLQNNNFYLFSIEFNNKICGFFELIENNSILTVSEI